MPRHPPSNLHTYAQSWDTFTSTPSEQRHPAFMSGRTIASWWGRKQSGWGNSTRLSKWMIIVATRFEWTRAYPLLTCIQPPAITDGLKIKTCGLELVYSKLYRVWMFQIFCWHVSWVEYYGRKYCQLYLNTLERTGKWGMHTRFFIVNLQWNENLGDVGLCNIIRKNSAAGFYDDFDGF